MVRMMGLRIAYAPKKAYDQSTIYFDLHIEAQSQLADQPAVVQFLEGNAVSRSYLAYGLYYKRSWRLDAAPGLRSAEAFATAESSRDFMSTMTIYPLS